MTHQWPISDLNSGIFSPHAGSIGVPWFGHLLDLTRLGASRVRRRIFHLEINANDLLSTAICHHLLLVGIKKKWWRSSDLQLQLTNSWQIFRFLDSSWNCELAKCATPQGTNSVAHTFLRSVRCGLAMQPWKGLTLYRINMNKHGVLSMGRKHHAYHDSNMILWNNLHPSGVLRSVYQKTLDVASCKGRLQLHNFALGFASGCGMIFTGWIRVTYGYLLPVAQKYAEYPVQIYDMRLPKNWSQQIPTNHIPIPWSSSRQTMRWRTSETKQGH